MGHLLALTAADQGDREQVAELARRGAAGDWLDSRTGYVDQDYSGPNAAKAAWGPARSGEYPIVSLGFVLLLRRWS